MEKRKEIIILGFALFSMFFGAGNLILPPSLGKSVGNMWIFSSFGFFLTGIGLPLLGILAFTRVGKLENFANKISSKFNTFYTSLLILVIGPLCAIPRTGSVTFEMGVLPLIKLKENSIEFYLIAALVSFIFFGITLFLVLNESAITDILGKFLTPIILIILALLIILGIKNSFTIKSKIIIENITSISSFSTGFITGYQTMDALASVLFGVLIIRGLEDKGIKNEKIQKKYLYFAGLIAASGLGIIYISLVFLGATYPQLQNPMLNLSTSQVTLLLAQIILGKYGKLAIGICVAAACLTTSVGLVALASDWFSKILNINYKKMATIICIVSALLSIIGLDSILNLSVPILTILYPVTIVLILLNILGIKQVLVFKTTVFTTLLVSSIMTIGQLLNFNMEFISFLPKDFLWTIPAIIVFIVTSLYSFKNSQTTF